MSRLKSHARPRPELLKGAWTVLHLDEVGLASSGWVRRSVGSTRFGFSWLVAFLLRKPPIMRLEKLGFPWILSSESRVINGLHEIFSIKFFLALFFVAKQASQRQPTIWHAEGMDCSWGKLNLISDFLQEIPARAVPVWPPLSKGNALSPNQLRGRLFSARATAGRQNRPRTGSGIRERQGSR
jgi:hypothetical protein